MSEDKDLYKILGLSRDASEKDIRRAYLDLSKENHPDKGGDEEMFKKIGEAYSVLSDEKQRQIYDMTGRLPGEGGGPGFGGGSGFPFGGGVQVDLSDIFGSMFGAFGRGQGQGQGPPGQRKKRAKGPNKVIEIALRLSDFYNGKKLQFNLERQVFCEDCSGEGCLNWKTCDQCRGSGVKESMMQIGPGMMAVNRGPCSSCQAQGRMKGKSCETCSGKGLVSCQKVLEGNVAPGTAVGDVITFAEMCSDHPEFEKAGDVLIRLLAADEELDLEREGKNLRYRTTISLSESLLGCVRTIKSHPGHIGGFEIKIPCATQNGDVIVLEGEGMPGASIGALLLDVRVVASEDEKKTVEKNKVILQSLFQ